MALDANSVRLVPFTAEHITGEYLSWLNDRERMRFSRQRLRSHSRESSLAYLASFKGTANHFWAIERLRDGQHVGSMTTYVDTQGKTADLGILVGHAGTGCGTQAWGLALEHAFETLGMRKATGGAVARNEAMVRIFRHWGMREEGRRREQELLDDGPADVLLYGLLRSEWIHERP